MRSAQKIKYIQAKYSGAPSKLGEKGSLSTMVVSALTSLPNIMTVSTRPKSAKMNPSESKEQGKPMPVSESKELGKKERGSPDQASKKRDPEELSLDSSIGKGGDQSSQQSIIVKKPDAKDAPLKSEESESKHSKKREHKSRKSMQTVGESRSTAEVRPAAETPHKEGEPIAKVDSKEKSEVRKSRKTSRREGYIYVQRSSRPSQWRRKWFILYSDRLSYYKAKEREQRQGTIALFSATIEKRGGEVGGHKHLLAITSPDRLFTLACETTAEQNTWFEEIQRNITWITKNPPISGLAIGRTVRLTSRHQKAAIEETQRQALELAQQQQPSMQILHDPSTASVLISPSTSATITQSPPLSPTSAGVPAKSALKKGDGKSRKRATISDAPAEEIKS